MTAGPIPGESSAERAAARLVLADGRVFEGAAIGARERATGEVVFTTSMTGYQEALTDPSYGGQMLVMTYPLQGNYGVNANDEESSRIQVRGFVVRELTDLPSHWRSRGTLDGYLREQGVPGISGIDTRALTRHLRTQGVLMGTLTSDEERRAGRWPGCAPSPTTRRATTSRRCRLPSRTRSRSMARPTPEAEAPARPRQCAATRRRHLILQSSTSG